MTRASPDVGSLHKGGHIGCICSFLAAESRSCKRSWWKGMAGNEGSSLQMLFKNVLMVCCRQMSMMDASWVCHHHLQLLLMLNGNMLTCFPIMYAF
jgi:hypothetical protein